MSAPIAVAPRFAVPIAGAVMAYAVGWGAIRLAITGFPPAAAVTVVLLCAAFLLALLRGAGARVRAILAGLFALSGIGAAFVAGGGRIAVADIWVSPAVACIALLLIWRRQHPIAWATIGGLIVLLWAVGGFAQVEDLGTLTTVLTLGVIAAAGRVLGWYAAQMQLYSQTEQGAMEWRIAQDAYQQSHQLRIEQTGRLAGAMLQRIVTADGRLEIADRAECRLLHQTIRDETRGRLLLNDEVRAQVHAHRRRGATVQLLDDGGLGHLDGAELALLHDEIAALIAPLTSDRIVIRSGTREGVRSVTVVATTPDPVAAALGQDDDEQVDLWHRIKIDADPQLTDVAR